MNIIGKKIVDVRWAKPDESDEFFGDQARFPILELEDGTIIIPSRDEEGNGHGVFFGSDGLDTFYVRPGGTIEDSSKDEVLVLIWSIEDVIFQANAEKIDITVEDAREIIKRIEHNYDPDVGVNWGVIDVYIKEYMEEKNAKPKR